jgi:hypothetical protein
MSRRAPGLSRNTDGFYKASPERHLLEPSRFDPRPAPQSSRCWRIALRNPGFSRQESVSPDRLSFFIQKKGAGRFGNGGRLRLRRTTDSTRDHNAALTKSQLPPKKESAAQGSTADSVTFLNAPDFLPGVPHRDHSAELPFADREHNRNLAAGLRMDVQIQSRATSRPRAAPGS